MKKAGIYTASFIVFFLVAYLIFYFSARVNTNPQKKIGAPVDSLNGVVVYFNGGTREVEGMDTVGNYYLGLKYQCVEFVNRYYFQYYHHKMPDPYGNAVDYFDRQLKDGELNKKRGLIQFANPSKTKPLPGDILIFDKGPLNKYGHIAIISSVNDKEIEVIQQNAGAYGNSRAKFQLKIIGDTAFEIENKKVLGRLRMP